MTSQLQGRLSSLREQVNGNRESGRSLASVRNIKNKQTNWRKTQNEVGEMDKGWKFMKVSLQKEIGFPS